MVELADGFTTAVSRGPATPAGADEVLDSAVVGVLLRQPVQGTGRLHVR